MINKIINKLTSLNDQKINYPFLSTYRSKQQQQLFNMPILKPLLILILDGQKIIGNKNKRVCHRGEFIFFTDIQSIDMRNIPSHTNYLALLIEFEYTDFYNLPFHAKENPYQYYTIGTIDEALARCILQFIDMLDWAPEEIVKSRKIEIIKLLIAKGYKNLGLLPNHQEISKKVMHLLKKNNTITSAEISKKVGMSASTLYRKLKSEGTNIQNIKEKIIMAKAIHLLQTTSLSIERVAEQVGYASSTRFSQRFKSYFGLTPKDLKRTK